MRYRALSPSGDMTFGSSLNNFYIDIPQAVGQAVETGLELWLGEWYLDTSLGTPYVQGVLGKFTQAEADGIIQARILEIEGVVDYANYQSVYDTVARSISISMNLDTIYGGLEVAITIPNFGPPVTYLTAESGEILQTEAGEGIII
jgi:hypothetical protein